MSQATPAHAHRTPASASDESLMLSISGLRGVVGSGLSPTTACRYVGALLAWMIEHDGARPGDAIVLGRDGRVGGEIWRDIAAAQARAAGFCVIDLGVVSTPTVGVAVASHRAAGGLVVTASHNPAQWNGLKPITRQGRAPNAADAHSIIQFFNERRAPHAPVEHLGERDADGAATHMHVARVLDAINTVTPIEQIKSRRYRVATDSVNASGAVGARLLLEALACNVTAINASGSGVFPHPPEPTRENLTLSGGLGETIRRGGCDIGFAQDPDADRLAILDEHGCYIGEEHTLVLAVEAVLSAPSMREGECLAANLSTSRMIDDLAARFGARVVRTPVGEAHVAQALVDHSGLIGGEGNGGVIWPRVVMIRDSLSAMALTLALMARSGRRLSELQSSTPVYSIVKRKKPITPGHCDRAVDTVSTWEGAVIDRQDGVRIDLPDDRAWLHIRASNTEPILRLIAEAPTESAAAGLLDEAERRIAEVTRQ